MRKIRRFLNETDEEINTFLSGIEKPSIRTCGVVVEQVEGGRMGGMSAKNRTIIRIPVMVSWDIVEGDELLKEIEEQSLEISEFKIIATELLDDRTYNLLKNNKQREIYLLERYMIPFSKSETILALIQTLRAEQQA